MKIAMPSAKKMISVFRIVFRFQGTVVSPANQSIASKLKHPSLRKARFREDASIFAHT
jgi:hypothetical protein